MQSASSRFWTRVAVSISYDDNDYTSYFKDKLLGKYHFIAFIILLKYKWKAF